MPILSLIRTTMEIGPIETSPPPLPLSGVLIGPTSVSVLKKLKPGNGNACTYTYIH